MNSPFAYYCAVLAVLLLVGCHQPDSSQTSDADEQDQLTETQQSKGSATDGVMGRGKPDSFELSNFFAKKEQLALAQPFVGVRTAQGNIEGLYPIRKTGVSTAPLVAAANAFLSSLTVAQRAFTQYRIDDVEWRRWSNVDNGNYTRQGISLKKMNAQQKEMALALVAASLSSEGFEQSRNIMKTDQTLRELNNDNEDFDEELYFITIMGSPSDVLPWGWQIDGHHLAANFFVLGDQVVFTPVFMGAEPVETTSGKHKGNILLQEEQNLGLTLLQSFTQEQKSNAIVGQKGREDMKAGSNQDNLVLEYEGIPATELSQPQKLQLLALIEEYVGNIRDGHAEVKMDAVRARIEETWFAWAGDTNDDSVFYYRVHSPVILIEFDHQGPVGIRSTDGSRAATRNHIHTMLRTPNGNDYGKDLLKQHLDMHH